MNVEPPVRLSNNADGTVTIAIGEASATLSRSTWSKLIAPPRSDIPAGEGQGLRAVDRTTT